MNEEGKSSLKEKKNNSNLLNHFPRKKKHIGGVITW